MNGVEGEVKDRLIKVIDTLEAYAGLNKSLKEVAGRLRQHVEKLDKPSGALLYTREYVEKFIEVYERTIELEKVVERYTRGGAIVSDIYSSCERLDESLKELLKIRSKTLFRERLAINIPIWVAVAFYVFDYISNTILNAAPNPTQSHIVYLTQVSLGVASAVIATNRAVAAYVVLLASTVLGLIHSTLILKVLQSTSLYLMLTFVSIIYLNIARLQSSSEYRERVKDLFKNVMDLIDRSKLEARGVEAVDENKLWSEALSIFKAIHRDRAEELLRFKVETMVMNGLNKVDALKKIIETYRKILE